MSIETEKTEEIKVPHFEGYRCLGYRIPNPGEYYLSSCNIEYCSGLKTEPWLVYEKLKRHVFEETGEYRLLEFGEYGLSNDGIMYWCMEDSSNMKYKILIKVE